MRTKVMADEEKNLEVPVSVLNVPVSSDFNSDVTFKTDTDTFKSDETNAEVQLTFWEHLDVLRGSLIRIIVSATALGIMAFFLKEPLFRVVLAPADGHFFVYRWLGADSQSLHLVNTGLTEQFLVHLKVALMAGLLAASPYILYVLYRFVSPALYAEERRVSVRVVASAYLMFAVGVAVNYILVFPLTVRFLGNYQVDASVENLLSISSYVDTLLTMSLIFGVVFEIPVVSWLLAHFGMLRSAWMTHYRRHAVVLILIVAAVITPTSDVFTLLIVSLPIWLLYELSILIVNITENKKSEIK